MFAHPVVGRGGPHGICKQEKSFIVGFPGRWRGLGLGVVALIVGPVIAIAIAAGGGGRPAVVVDSRVQAASAEQSNEPAHANLYELRPRTPLPSPTPKPTEPPPPPPPPPLQHNTHVVIPPAVSGDVVSIIRAAAAQNGVSGDWMVEIALCESTLRPNAYNPRGPYYGLFQFLMSTFRANGGSNIWDPADQANVAAKMLAHGQAWQWACA